MTRQDQAPTWRDLDILYEDNHLLAVSKPANLLVQGDRTGDVTLLGLARASLKERHAKPGQVYLGLVHRPRLVLLDEPTVGIDPQARINVLDVVRGLARDGAAVLYTTHYLEEAESLCDELAIMDHGRIHAQGSIDALKAELGEGSVLTVQGSFAKADLAAVVERNGALRIIELDDGRALLNAPRGRADVGGALESLYGSGLHLSDVTVKEPNLQDLFLKLTGRELRD